MEKKSDALWNIPNYVNKVNINEQGFLKTPFSPFLKSALDILMEFYKRLMNLNVNPALMYVLRQLWLIVMSCLIIVCTVV